MDLKQARLEQERDEARRALKESQSTLAAVRGELAKQAEQLYEVRLSREHLQQELDRANERATKLRADVRAREAEIRDLKATTPALAQRRR